jgi:multidrug resistance efflux pump
MTVERPGDRPFGLEEIESLRLTCELCTPRLSNLYERDRWFGARAAGTVRKGLSKLVGPTHTWAKALVMGVLAALLFLILAQGPYTAEGTAVIEPVQQQTIQAPFDGVLMDVLVEPGKEVPAGQELARLNTEELQGELAEARAQRAGYQKQADAAGQRGDVAEMEVAKAQRDQAAARIAVLEYRIERARVRTPMAGTVLSGDLKRQIGTSVQRGQVLFEVAPLQTLRAELAIPEDQIGDVTVSHGGQLAMARDPGQRIDFQVERIHPMAEVVEQKNVFKVRVRLVGLDLAGRHNWLRPGMEGVGKVQLGRQPYAWLWTRKLVNWIRMKLWL